MIEVDVLGMGAWSEHFANWAELKEGLDTGEWQDGRKPVAGILPPAVRRRAPVSVKMAIDVMQQACSESQVKAADLATVFCSAMGDIQLTDSICRTLAESPQLISPTQFHNSVHNAATGYWTISNGAHEPANAISAFTYSSSMAFLEAVTQVVQENIVVLLAFEEVAAPPALYFACHTDISSAGALVLAPPGARDNSIARIRTEPRRGTVDGPDGDPLPAALENNRSMSLMALMSSIYIAQRSGQTQAVTLPLAPEMHLNLSIESSSGWADSA